MRRCGRRAQCVAFLLRTEPLAAPDVTAQQVLCLQRPPAHSLYPLCVPLPDASVRPRLYPHPTPSRYLPVPPPKITPQLKDVLMALYFAADHVVWAHQIGLLTNKKAGERAQKVSLYSWALGSVATMVLEANTILAVSSSSSTVCDGVGVWVRGRVTRRVVGTVGVKVGVAAEQEAGTVGLWYARGVTQ